jgi:branched-chain amino acid aminotransferase
MRDLRVATYEAGAQGPHLVGRHANVAAASAALPEGAYTTLRTYAGRGVVRLERHRRRLEDSVTLQGRPASIDPAALRRVIGAVLDEAGHAESRLRLTFAPPRLFLTIEPFVSLPTRFYEVGVACATLDLPRENPHAKDTRFIATAEGAYGRLPAGVEEGLIVGEGGVVLEGLSSNFFAVLDGTLRTEEEHALAGVTRSLVLEVAEALLPIERRGIHRHELPRAGEAFLTSVSREVLPVVRIDGRPVGDGRPGEKTQAIVRTFADVVRREAETL